MIKTVIRAIYAALISIVLISIIIASLTGYSFISQSPKYNEIFYFIRDIYKSQKTVIIDVVELSKLLLKDTSDRIASEYNNLLPKDELLTDLKGKSQLDESSILEDNGDNPVGNVIEPSLSEVMENRLTESSEEPLFERRSGLSLSEMKIEMN